MKKILGQIGSYAFTIVIIFVFLIAYGSINNRFYRVVVVEGNSMSPVLWYGDLIVVTPAAKDLPVNSVALMSVDGRLVTHRIVGFEPGGRPITKGDANEVVDDFSRNTLKVIGIVRMRLPAMGYPFIYLASFRGSA